MRSKPKVIEQFIESRYGNDSRCEDIIYTGNNFFAVIDGATEKDFSLNLEESSGHFMAEALSEGLEHLDSTSNSDDAIDFLTKWVNQKLKNRPHFDSQKTIATLVIYSVHRREIWRVGDCWFSIDGKVFPPSKSIEIYTSGARAAYNHAQILNGVTIEQLMEDDIGRKFILPLLQLQHVFVNNVNQPLFGFGAINGSPVPKKFREVTKVQEDSKFIILASDGYPAVFQMLNESERYLKSLLKTDPLCISKHLATKGLQKGWTSFDDRAYLRIEL